MNEELRQGQDHERRAERRPRSWRLGGRRRATLAGSVVVVAVVGWQVLAIVGRPAAPSTPLQRLPPVPARGSLVVDQVCTSFTGAGPIEVSFRLVNNTSRRLRVLAVRPLLPLGMLRAEAAVLAAGACGPKGTAAGRTDLGPGQGTPVTFRLTPTVQCPQPAPVQASIGTIEDGVRIDREVRVLSDLGQVKVAGCRP